MYVLKHAFCEAQKVESREYVCSGGLTGGPGPPAMIFGGRRINQGGHQDVESKNVSMLDKDL